MIKDNFWLGSEALDSFFRDYVEPKELKAAKASVEDGDASGDTVFEDETEDESLDPVGDDFQVISGQECIAEVIRELEQLESYASEQYSNETVKYLMEVTISDLKKMAGLE